MAQPTKSGALAILAPDPAGIPSAAKEERRWVVWRSDLVNQKETKIPYIAQRGQPHKASSTDAQTWRTWDEAWSAYQDSQLAMNKPYAGVGFVLVAGFAGGDFDGCRDPGTGQIAAWARPYLDLLLARGAYVDISPSSAGFKFIVTGAWRGNFHKRLLPHDPWGGKEHAAVEVYDQGRYFTLTGQAMGTGASQIVEAQDVLDTLARDFAPPIREVTAPNAGPDGRALADALPDDQGLLDRAHDAHNGVKFAALWRGDVSACGNDHSASDLALCSLLAFWTGPDAARIDRLFRQSALMRPKWDHPHRADGTTYGAMTIALALQRAEFYNPDWKRTGAGPEGSSASQEPAADAAPITHPRRLYQTGPTPLARALRDAGWGALIARTYEGVCAEFGQVLGEPYTNGEQPAPRIIYGKAIAKTTEDTTNRSNAALDALTRAHFLSRVPQCERDAAGHIRKTWYVYQLPNAPAWQAFCDDPTLFQAPGPLRTSLADKARYAERKAQRLALTFAREALDHAVQRLNAQPHDAMAIAAQREAWTAYAAAKAAAVPRKSGRPRATPGLDVQSTPTMAYNHLENLKSLLISNNPENRNGFSGADTHEPEVATEVATSAAGGDYFGFSGDATSIPVVRKSHPFELLLRRGAHRAPMPAPLPGGAP